MQDKKSDYKWLGGCACGAVRYEFLDPPNSMVNCHCRDCQLSTGSGYSPTIIIKLKSLEITKGQPIRYEKKSESGSTAVREFCGFCGTPLFASSSGFPNQVGVKASSLDNPNLYHPEAEVWVKSKQLWDKLDPNIEKFEKGRLQHK